MGGQNEIGALARGSMWMIAMRWVIRGLGLFSTIVLARLLHPEDFGVVAMAMVVVGFLEVFTYTGVDLAVIRTPSPTREHYDTAWTLGVGQGLALALALLLAAPLAVGWFGDERVAAVIAILAAGAAVGGFENIGVIDFRRELQFDREFRYGVYRKIVSFLVTLGLALTMRNYWALVAGTVAGRCAEVALSYLLHPYRPRFSVARLGEIWSFSQWLLTARIGRYVTGRTDEFLVGGYNGATTMGSYYVASDVATSPTQEIVLPMARGLYPVYSRMAHAPETLHRSFEQVLGFTALLSVSVGLGISAVAEDLVAVLLGSRWESAVGLMHWLALAAAATGILTAFDTWMTVRGRVRGLALFTWAHFALLLPALILAATQGPVVVAMARTAVTVATAPLLVAVAVHGTSVSWLRVLAVLWPKLLAGAAMWVVVRAVTVGGHGPLVSLAADAALGAVTYAAVLSLLWWVRGRPEGVERTIFTLLRQRFARAAA
jgi:O-antigen/teichoic acid export membrane protein